MGVASLREAFNTVAAPRYTASMAHLSTERFSGQEWSRLRFSGNGADGVTFDVVSERIPAGGDVILAAQATAQKMLDAEPATEPYSAAAVTPAGRRLDEYLAGSIREFKEGSRNVVVELKRPVELAGLKGRLLRAKAIEADIAGEGKKLDAVLDQIEERKAQIAAHRGQLENYNDELGTVIRSMVDGSNEPPEAAGNGGASPAGPADAPTKGQS